MVILIALQNTDILLKDSIYGAIGLAAPVLDRSSDFDFGQFLSNTLVHEIQIQQPGYNIIRRRAAIVIGQWMPVKKGLNSQLIYQIFQHLLDNGNQLNDQVVRITAGRQFANVVETFEFSDELFRPYAPTILTRLMAMIEEVDLIETKKALLHTVMVIVVKMEKLVGLFN